MAGQGHKRLVTVDTGGATDDCHLNSKCGFYWTLRGGLRAGRNRSAENQKAQAEGLLYMVSLGGEVLPGLRGMICESVSQRIQIGAQNRYAG
jgi:hypothetical protein